MKTTAVLVAASAALASAQVTLNETTGKYNCAKPNAAYCAGDSLRTDIIIRCDQNGVGQPGRCSDNLDGEPPVGDFTALCWTSNDTAGDAACEKNCVVYGGSGNFPSDFTLPASLCTPTYTAPGGSATGSGTVTYPPGTPTTTPPASGTGGGSACPPASSTTYPTYVPPPPVSTGTGGGGGYPSGNVTYSATNAPTTTTGPGSVATAGASANGVTGALAVLGLAAAYIL